MGQKGDAQRVRVIESASYCLSNFGERGATFQAISDHCQLSQASVVKYLKSRDNIFPMVLEHWISRARQITQEALLEVGTPEEKLRHYFQVSIKLFFERPDINKIYLMLHYFATFDERYRVVNTQIKTVAQDRIAQIIQAGIDDGSFAKANLRADAKVDAKLDAKLIAKTMHNSLVGFLLSSVTEITQPSDLQLAKVVEDSCLAMVLPKA
jgi:AcrR family transcriptional regulator